jgi:single-strand DNA-binding protein
MINRVILMGRLGQDAMLSYTQSGIPRCVFSIATNKRTPQGDKATWHECVAWDKAAEYAGNKFKKGSLIYVEGELEQREWKDRGGNERATVTIRVTRSTIIEHAQPKEEEAAPRRVIVEQELSQALPDDLPF